MNALIWIVLPYACLAVFVAGHVWRWRHDQFGWTTHTSQLLENRLLRLGSPLFHLGAFGVIGGHAMGLLVPASWTALFGIPEHTYHLVSVTGGTITGIMLVAGLALLIARRFVDGRIRRVTTTMDKILYAALAAMVVLGMSGTMVINLFGAGYDYRETIAVWFRGIFWFQPDPSLMTGAPLVFQWHAIGGFLFLALWPFTRLVHVWSAPLAYLWRPYVVYRGRRTAAPVPQPAPAAVRDTARTVPADGTTGRPTGTPRPPVETIMSAAAPDRAPRPAALMLVLATVGFAVNFWAWALLSPLATRFAAALDLTSFQQSLLVAVPVVVGSLGRIPVGALTDRFGGRVMFPLVSLATIVPVLHLGLFGHQSYPALLAGGFFLGIGGTIFAVGVPFVNAWFPPERRGLAVGVFGMGMGGTAISALTTVKLVGAVNLQTPFLLTAAVLAVYAAVAWLLLRDAPQRLAPATPLATRLHTSLRLRITWEASALYAVAFGGYVAFSVYLPAYLKNAYGLTQADAANRMAGFVLLAVLMRPIGGWLSDRFAPSRVLASALGVVAFGAVVQSLTPALAPVGTAAFLGMAAALGTGSGATFALVAKEAPAGQVGSVTGVVGAAGGLGGFVPPLVMGTLYGNYHSYALGLLLLAVVALAALLLDLFSVGRRATAAP